MISSFCSGGDCIAVEREPGGNVALSDSKNPGPSLLFTAQEWAAFILGAKAGEFDVEALR